MGEVPTDDADLRRWGWGHGAGDFPTDSGRPPIDSRKIRALIGGRPESVGNPFKTAPKIGCGRDLPQSAFALNLRGKKIPFNRGNILCEH